MGNLNFSSLTPQHEKPDVDLSTPILDREELQKSNNNNDSPDKPLSRRTNNRKRKSGNKKSKTDREKTKLDDMISNPKDMLPKEFSSLEELKNIHLARKQKKKEKEKEFSIEWDLTAFAGGKVTCFAVSPDSKYLVSGTDKGHISIFDLGTKIITDHIFDLRESIRSIFISEDCKFVYISQGTYVNQVPLSGGKIDYVNLWRDFTIPVSSIVFLAEGKYLIGTPGDPFRDTNTGERKWYEGSVSSLTLTNDKAYLISAYLDKSIKILDVNGWEEVHHFVGAHEDIVCSIIVSHDDQYIITGSKDRSVKVFDLNAKQEIFHFKEICEEGVMSVAISQDNKHVYCTAGLSIKILSLETKQVSELKNLHTGSIIAVALSKNRRYLISAALDGSIMILDNETQEKSYLKDIHRNPINVCVISIDNKYIASGSSEGIKVFDFEKRSKTPLYAVDCGGETVHSLIISSRNKYLLAGCAKSIRLFELATMKQTFEFPMSRGYFFGCFVRLISSIAKNYPITISNFENFIVFPSLRSSIKIVWMESHEEKELNFESEVVSICLHPDYSEIIVGLSDNSVKIITGYYEKLRIKDLFKSTVEGTLQMSSDGKLILISDYKRGSISLYDVLTNQLVSKLNLEDQISFTTLSEDNKNIIIAIDRQIKVFDLTGTSLDDHYFRFEGITTLTISEDNQYLVAGFENGMLNVTRFGIKKEAHELLADANERHSVESVAIWEEYGWIVLACDDFSIKIFDIQTKLEVNCIEVPERDKIKACTLQRNGPNVVFVFEDGKVKKANLITKEEEDCGKINIKGTMSSLFFNTPSISEDGQFIALAIHWNGRIDELIIVFDLCTKQEKHKIVFKPNFQEGISSLGISNQNKYFFFSRCAVVNIYDLCTGQRIAYFEISAKAAISNDNRYLITGSKDYSSVNIFDIETQNDLFPSKKKGERDTCYSVKISDDDKYILAVSARTIKIFDRLTKKELQKFRNIHIQHDYYQKGVEKNIVISQSKKYTLVGTCLLSPFYSATDEVFYISSKISIDSLFATKYDDFLTSLSPNVELEEKNRFFQSCQDMIILPYHWSALHLLAIMNPSGISQIPEYSQFKVPSLLDSYGKTPLHYLLAQKNRDYAIINITLNYIIDYLQDKQRMTAYEHEQICYSLSNCFFFIVSKVSPGVSQKFFTFCYPETYPLRDQVLPSFGLPDQNYTFSKITFIKQEVLTKLYQEGDDRIIFRTNMIYLDYDPRSDDMLMAVHSLYENEQPIIFKIPFIENLIDHLWETTRTTMYLTALTYSTFMIFLSFYIGFGQNSFVLEIIILFLTVAFFISELIQIFTLRMEYLQSVWNWIDIAQLLLSFIFICTKIADGEVSAEAWIVSFIIMTGYLRWLSYLRLFSPTRILIEIILAVMYDMLGFIAVIASILIGFSLIFLEFGRKNPDPQEYSFHFYNTFKLLFGNYDDTDFNLSQTILVAFLMCVLNVVLLNLLISIIGSTFSKVQEERDLIDAKTRLEMIQEAILMMRAINPKKTVNRGYLIYKLPAAIEQGNLESREWEARINKIDKTLKENNEEQKNMKNEIKNLETQVASRIRSEAQVSDQIKNLEAQVVDQIKNEVNSAKEEKKEEVRQQIKNEVNNIKEDVQGLKDLVNLVLTNLNQLSKKTE